MASCSLLVRDDGRVERASPAAVEAFRLGSAAPERLAVGSLFPGRGRAEDIPIGQAIRLAARRLDGTRFEASAVRSPMPPILRGRHLLVITDETARLETERRAREASEMLASVFGAVTASMVARDADGRFLAANAAAERFLCGPPGGIVGRLISETVPEPRASLILRKDAEVIRTGKPLVTEWRGLTDGRETIHEISRYPLRSEGGEVRGVIGIARDVTEARQAGAALLHAKEEAERASAERARFLAAASHDLRQPVQSISLVAATLEAESLTPGGRDALAQMTRAADALRNLLDGLLDIDQLEAGVAKANLEAFRLDDLLAEVAAAAGPTAVQKGLAFAVAPTTARVLSDRVRLGQMLLNLAQNAVRYTDTGSVAIKVGEMGGDRVRIEVRDTGIGIHPDHLSKIWDEFYQVGNPERDRSRGLGLGLSIVARLSRLLEHRVEVDTKPGEGSLFSVEVPLARSDTPMPDAPVVDARSASVRGQPLVVVIDDDTLVLRALESYLGGAGYRVVAAETAEAAVSALDAAGIPDVVVADYRLRGGRTGTGAVEAVRRSAGARLPGIILTGETDGRIEGEVAELGLTLLRKPMSGPALKAALGRILAAGSGQG